MKYEILNSDGKWETVKKGQPDWREGWLRYELKDGTVGIKRPGTWRPK
jgi:hypothetical protein